MLQTREIHEGPSVCVYLLTQQIFPSFQRVFSPLVHIFPKRISLVSQVEKLQKRLK